MQPTLGQGSFTRAFDGANVNAHENVTFYTDSIINPAKSDAAGREVHDDVEMWELRFPGNNYNIYAGRVTDTERARWPQQYDAFKKRGSHANGIAGTSLEQWPFVGRSTIAELRYLNILTVEMLAKVDDNGISRMGPNGRKLVECAKAWLAEAADSAATMQLAAAKVALEERVALQDSKIAELTMLLQTVSGQLAQINAAGAAGVGPAHVAQLPGNAPAVAPSAASSIDATADFQPRKRGRPSNEDLAARAAASAA